MTHAPPSTSACQAQAAPLARLAGHPAARAARHRLVCATDETKRKQLADEVQELGGIEASVAAIVSPRRARVCPVPDSRLRLRGLVTLREGSEGAPEHRARVFPRASDAGARACAALHAAPCHVPLPPRLRWSPEDALVSRDGHSHRQEHNSGNQKNIRASRNSFHGVTRGIRLFRFAIRTDTHAGSVSCRTTKGSAMDRREFGML